jgi:hypothetical protein
MSLKSKIPFLLAMAGLFGGSGMKLQPYAKKKEDPAIPSDVIRKKSNS